MLKMRGNNRYFNWAETCYKICYLLFAANVLLFRKIGGTPFAKSKVQRMSANFFHCIYLIFEPILLRRKFWGIPLHRNGIGLQKLQICLLALKKEKRSGGEKLLFQFPSVSLSVSLEKIGLPRVSVFFTAAMFKHYDKMKAIFMKFWRDTKRWVFIPWQPVLNAIFYLSALKKVEKFPSIVIT